jgi:hypothetical protein
MPRINGPPSSVQLRNSDVIDDKFKEVNTRLRYRFIFCFSTKIDDDAIFASLSNLNRRLLAEERKTLHQYRERYSEELRSRTELELFLRRCVDDVRKEIARRYEIYFQIKRSYHKSY